jgi:DNA-binding transcriptional regulator YiaG
MARPYSQKFIDAARDGDTRRVGIELARQCIAANLPAKYVAHALGVSRATIHNWFRGRILRGRNEEVALAFMRLVKQDRESGVLPANTIQDAKAYIEDMIGKKI